MGLKLVAGTKTASDREIELRLDASDGEVSVVLYEDGEEADAPYIGTFKVVDGKIEFDKHSYVNSELVRTDAHRQIVCT
jgi:hypothetical protein